VPPAIKAILSSPNSRVQAFLLAGHVCAVMGYHEYPALVDQFHIPMVVTGFEPLDIVQGILEAVKLLEEGKVEISNPYSRVVSIDGNSAAQKHIAQVFEECDRKWRGIGTIPISGWRLKQEFDSFNAERKFDVGEITAEESPLCIAGQILQGLNKPQGCPAFGTACIPEHPLGATMVSSEGACAAYYRYGRVTINA
jgi:hydrogenase expression/formation protein HypD